MIAQLRMKPSAEGRAEEKHSRPWEQQVQRPEEGVSSVCLENKKKVRKNGSV